MRKFLLGFASAAMLLGVTAAQAANPFYQGKTITLINGLAPGGSADLQCRLLAQFLPAHIPGDPVVLVKNIPGAGGMNATNFVGKDAKKDGLTLICGSLDAQGQLMKNNGFATDLTKFSYITGNGDSSVMYIASDVPPGMKTGADIFKADGIKFGGLAVDSNKDITARLALTLLGIKDYKYVTGLNGDAESRAAIQQKFVNLLLDSMTGYFASTVSTIIKTGIAVPVFQWGHIDDSGHLTIRDQRVPDLPTFKEFYQAHFGKPPSGDTWDLIETIVGYNDVALNSVGLPSGTPPEAAAALRSAIDPLNQDPDFIAASDQIRGKGVRQQPGTKIAAAVDRYLNMPPAMYQLFQDTIALNGSMKTSK